MSVTGLLDWPKDEPNDSLLETDMELDKELLV